MIFKKSPIFWDYDDIDLSTESGKIVYLNRKIMFGEFNKKDISMIRRLFDKLTMQDYWRHYFTIYFQKYGLNK